MARISGIELQDNWNVDYALTKIKGIGWALSTSILDTLKIDSGRKVSDLNPGEVSKIAKEIEQYPIEGELARQVKSNVTRLQATGAYRGLRHSRGLPARGQRTRSNARTKRGKRKTVGAFRKEALSRVAQDKSKEEGK